MSLNGFISGFAGGIGQGVSMYEQMPGMVGQDGTADNPGKGASKAANQNAYNRAMMQHWKNQDSSGSKSVFDNTDPSTYPAGMNTTASASQPGAMVSNSGAVPFAAVDSGTDGSTYSQGGYVKSYADGGAVEGDDDTVQGGVAPAPQVQAQDLPPPQPKAAISSPIDGSPIDPDTGNPANAQQQIAQSVAQEDQQSAAPAAPTQADGSPAYQTVLQAAAGEALKYNSDIYQLHGASAAPGAVGNQPSPNQQAFAKKADVDGQPMKFTPDEAQAIEKAIDPNGDLPVAQRSMFALQKGYEYYRNKGDPSSASRFAAMWVNTAAETSQKLGAQAQALLKDGDQTGAVHKLLQAYNIIPDGQSASIAMGQDGQPRVLLQDNSGKPLGAFPITPAAIYDMANQTKVGNTVWKSMVQAAQGGYTAAVTAQQKQAAIDANQRTPYVPDASGGVPIGANGAPMQQAPQPAPQQATPQSAPPQPSPQGAVPVQSAPQPAQQAVPAQQPQTPAAPAGMQFKGFDQKGNAVFVDSDGDLHTADGEDVDDGTPLTQQGPSPTPQPTPQAAPQQSQAVPMPASPQSAPVTQQGNPNLAVPQRTVLLTGDDATARPALPTHYAPSPEDIKAAQASGDPAAASKLMAAYRQRNAQIDTDYKQQLADYSSKTKSNGLKAMSVNDAETANKIQSGINDSFDSAVKQLPDPTSPGKNFSDAKDNGQSFMNPVAPSIKAVAKDILLHNNNMRDSDTAVQTAMTLVAPDDKDANAATFRPVGYTADGGGVVLRMHDGTQLAVSVPAYQKIVQTHAALGGMYRGAVKQADQPNQYAVMAKDALHKIGAAYGSDEPSTAGMIYDQAMQNPGVQKFISGVKGAVGTFADVMNPANIGNDD